ncbi:DUF4259 domain-containing protein [Corynebacterium sp. 153RC1]|uniref:DUF4259 domain-containing protein n=1 Tax=unclassified Corynebacterium TaxID=2624378 RepID=UPI00211C5B60|nr:MULTISPECIES: DUF4259 domain-containing protein [unclassified Corynebacterium]MCQ9352125.1 DUF4259 domain-containing protein [Corynebacterium sp. 209RC1]MCQ9354127.1 DUF4259 domain-containing protein [Corynebacterium sp. 1222RC1]MCQ9356407.1 DUF4259 domain-containing protein [Corynebacterium sp. 122RC1]MCQ9358509.1 DUF4259 domain-containing protein [Corynebacterium sp. 142RC1]MCQ9361021.1 DUF4259 domain-containing protein [Corynebacterium sp. 153RC1]
MSGWDTEIFTEEANTDFLEELLSLEAEDIVESVRDACLLAQDPTAGETDKLNALAAATIAAIWSGAPYTSGEIVDEYPFIRELSGQADETLRELASGVLEQAETEEDLDPFLEALS